ncbi:P-loop containing nucleoside triphosphate hydrolase protein [Wilcoxina mikolae CBS 423.85]|nr:P-loop containing nucleoside triphosphate hydrolase protein [Wilcoxina mikolae CBS 423.85]
MSQWPQQQPPYDPYQQQQQVPYQNQQPYNPAAPPGPPKPAGGSMIKTLNIFSSKPSYLGQSSSSPFQPGPPSSTQYVASPQSYTQPQAPWTTPAPFPPPAPQAHQQSPTASYPTQQQQTYQAPPPPAPPPQPTPALAYTPVQPQPQPPPPQSPISTSVSGSSHGRDELVQKLQSELDDMRQRVTEKEEELLRARHDATELRNQVEGSQRQLAVALQEGQQLRANAESNHKLAVEKDQELSKVRKEMFDQQTAQGQELERAKQEALALRQQFGQLSATQQDAQQLRVNAETNHKLAVDKDLELNKIRKEMFDLQASQGQELERVKQEAFALRQQLGQLTAAQQEAQQLRANAEINHKLAVDKDQELNKARKEMFDLQATHGQDLERAKQEALALHQQLAQLAAAKQEALELRQQVEQNTTFQEAYAKMYEELHELKATLAMKDAEIAILNLQITTQSTLPISPVTTPPVWPPNAEVPHSGLTGTNTSPPPAPPPTQPFWQPVQPAPYQPPAPSPEGPIAGIPASWVAPGSQPTIPGSHEAEDIGEEPEPTPSEKEWQRQKDFEGETNPAFDLLMTELTGLETVKAHLLRMKSKIETAVRQGIDLKRERFDIVLLGNPGTGKTDMVQIYSMFMCYCGIVPSDSRILVRGSELLASDGVTAAKSWIEKLRNVGGGVFVLDDAHYLTQNALGIQILDSILAEMESYENSGKIVFVFAGHNSTVESHPGLARKIPCVLQLEDYTDRELLQMLRREIDTKYNKRMQVEGGMGGLYMRVLIRRLGRGRGSAGFGNAREVEKAFTRIRERQGDRLNRERRDGLSPDDFFFTKEDLIGPDPSQAILKSTAWKKLQELIGLDAVKQSVRSMIDMIETNYKRELQEKPPMEVSLNRVFLGSPGTGKTSVAKLYGQILVDLGLLSNGEVVTKNPSDFVGNVLGETETKTKAILAATVGKVLIIDEAYMLYPAGTNADSDIYKTAVIDTLVAEVQSTPGEDRCVLLLGYEKQIETMFQNVNPGLARRFAIESAFHFHDFSDLELRQILELKLKQQGLHATEDAKRVAGEVLARTRVRPNFGNAGEVENAISQAKVRYQTRISKIPAFHRPVDVVFEPQDFDPEFARGATAATNCRKLFEDVVGCEDVVAKLEGYQKIAVNAKAAGIELHELIPTNFLFKGPPGTGKTMTARKMGQIFYDMGFLSSNKVVECSASELIGQFVGQTGPKTQKLFEKALGQVLFIDEAYRLGEGGYGPEAVNELVDILTKPTYLGKIVVILAGYDDDMNQLLAVNSGLSSRFPETITFRNMSPEHCIEVLLRDLEQKKISAPFLRDTNSRAYRDLRDLIVKLSSLPSWGNARDVKTLAKTMIGIVYKTSVTPQATPMLAPEDALECVKRLLEERKARANMPQIDPVKRRAQNSYQVLS